MTEMNLSEFVGFRVTVMIEFLAENFRYKVHILHIELNNTNLNFNQP